MAEEAEVGAIYLGTVAKTTDFGAFVTIMPGTDGLCHISELAAERVRQTEDVVKEGDQIEFKAGDLEVGTFALGKIYPVRFAKTAGPGSWSFRW